jgi:hypothetical protein
MKTNNLISLRAAARELEIDRATLTRIVNERRIPPAGHKGPHAVFELATLRRARDLEWYGSVSAPAAHTYCDECGGALTGHRDGKPCPTGSHDFCQLVNLELLPSAAWLLYEHTKGDEAKATAIVRKWLAQVGGAS